MKSISFTLLAMLFALQMTAQVGNLRIQGEAIIYETPELLSIQIPLNSKNASYEECSAELTRTYNALVDALAKAGIDRQQVKTSGLNISENYQWTDRERKLDGYVGSLNVTARIPHTTAMLNAFMKTMSNPKFNFGYNLSFALSESQKERLETEAIRSAVADARSKADVLIESLGVKLLSIEEVSYGITETNAGILVRRDMAKMSNDMEAVELNPNELEIRKTVSIVWLIAN